MSPQVTSVLLVEDDASYARFVEQSLAFAAPDCTLGHAPSLQAALDHLSRHRCDAVLLDLGLPDSNGLQTVVELTKHAPGVAVVVLTGYDDHNLASAALQAGAQDYVMKSTAEADALARAIRYAVERRRASLAIRERGDAFRWLFQASPLAIVTVDTQGMVRMWNPAAERMFGWRAPDVVGRPLPFVLPETREVFAERLRVLFSGASLPSHEIRAERKGGLILDLVVSASPLYDEGERVIGATAIFQDITEQKIAERALRESERRYRLLFERNPQPIWVVDDDSFRFLAVNDAAVRAYGYTADEFLTMTVLDLHLPEDVQRLRESLKAAGGASRTSAWRHRHKDGTEIEALVTSHPLQFGGRPARLVSVEDVTEKAAAERRLRFLGEATSLLSSVDLAGSLDGIAALAVQEMCDAAAIALVNSSLEVEQIHTACADPRWAARLADPRDLAGAVPPPGWLEALRSGVPLILHDVAGPALSNYLQPGSGGSWEPDDVVRSMLLVPLTSHGVSLGLISLFSTRRHRPLDEPEVHVAEALARRVTLALENARLFREARELFDADLTGNFIATPSGELLACNRTFAVMLGFPDVEAARTASAVDLFGGERGWCEFVTSLERESELRQIELTVRSRTGGEVQVLASAAGLFDRRGLLRIRGQFYDLSSHKALEAQLRQSQKIEAIGRLAGGIAHDFNNLLTVIGGQIERLQEELPEDHPLRRSVDAVAQAADRAAGLTQQLLAFSRRQVLSPQVISLNDVVRRVHSMLERVIGEDITCDLSLQPDLLSVKADPGRIEQAILNLAVNARDAMPSGGSLTITTANVELDDAFVRNHVGARPGQHVVLSVKDTGCGMDAETRARIFEPFFTTKELGKGTGLGLSTVYGIVKQSDGYIWVDSEVGRGAAFHIYLPGLAREPDAAPAGQARQPAPGGTETLLLVEDEDGVRELIEEMLTSQGYKVFAASRGPEALQISELVDGPIDLLITDVIMAQMSGREVAERLLQKRPDMRVLYLSGYTDDAISHHGILEPGAFFLQKPFARPDLLRKVREVLGSEPS